MKVTSVSMKGSVSILLPGEKDKFERNSMIHARPGRTMTAIPGMGVLVEVEGQDGQLIPFEHFWYARIARPEAKGK
jgi:hypothetical protein